MPLSTDGLVVERAVTELVMVRRELVQWMNDYTQGVCANHGCCVLAAHPLCPLEHGRAPQLQDAANESPALYQKFRRYLALRDYVRNSNL